MTTGRLLGSGRANDVYEIDDTWVLRRNREGWGDSLAEGAVMEHVRAPGYPVPRVRLADSTPTELVLRRLSGPTMVQACLAGSLDADQAGATVADLLRRLHTIPARHSAEPGHRVLHLDLHPDNVMLTPDGPQVLIVKGPLSPVRAAGFGRSADDRHRVDLHQDSLPDEPRHDCRTSGER